MKIRVLSIAICVHIWCVGRTHTNTSHTLTSPSSPAQELRAMFSEMSALSGTNVLQAHHTLANLLLARENEELEMARKASLYLNAQSQKRRCYC